MALAPKLQKRFRTGLKKLRPILREQRQRDVSEADTVTLVKEVLSQVLGYDKFLDLSGQYAVKGQFCDLAIKSGGRVSHFIEVKAIGIALTEKHLLQALHYAASEGVEWVVLTNAISWQLYSVIFGKPIGTRLIAEFDVFDGDGQAVDQLSALHAMSKEGCRAGVHVALKARMEALDRHVLAALLLNNRRVLARLCEELCALVKVKVEARDLPRVLEAEVIKRDVLESTAYREALQRIGGGKRVEVLEDSPRIPKATKKSISKSDVTLGDMIKVGTLTAPAKLYREYLGKRVQATLHADGTIEYAGKRYDNPSAAGAAARMAVTGKKMATNGWGFWLVERATGPAVTLATLRDAPATGASTG